MIEIMNKNCIDGLNDLILQNKKVHLIIADPPYTMTKRGKSCRPNYMKNNMKEDLFELGIPKCEDWFKLCYDCLENETHFYTFCNINDITNYLNASKKIGFKLHNIISMIKDTMMPNRWYLKQTELILFFRKGKAKPINDMTSRDNINVEMPTIKNGKIHITQKPLSLIEKLVTNSSLENEIVLDPFSGSGTTALACKNNNRKFIGFEVNKIEYDKSIKRVFYKSEICEET